VFEVIPPLVHILKPGQVHCWDFTQIPKGYVLMFREEVLQSFPGAREKLFEFSAEIRFRDPHDLMQLFHQCYDEFKRPAPQMDMLSAYLNLVILKLYYLSDDQIHSVKGSTNLLYAFKKLVDQRYHEYKQVSQYADLLHTSPARLNDACKMVGKSAQSVIKERIVLEAKNMLFHTDKTVAEVASELTFSDASNFVKFFKAHTRLTPLQYRQLG
jgi:AraC-like DNA-binding protein